MRKNTLMRFIKKGNDALLIHYTIWKRSAKLRVDTFTRAAQKREDALIHRPCHVNDISTHSVKKRKDTQII